MSLTFQATYENGVLRPDQPLPLREHECVQVRFIRRPAGSSRPMGSAAGKGIPRNFANWPCTLSLICRRSHDDKAGKPRRRLRPCPHHRSLSSHLIQALPLSFQGGPRRGLLPIRTPGRIAAGLVVQVADQDLPQSGLELREVTSTENMAGP
jgi:hypothetical protein